MNEIIENLNWRYATKKYDPSKKLSDEQRDIVMEALRLAPSSFGLQPYTFVHVTDPLLREKLKSAAYGQPQITDASEFFVLCAKTSLSEKDVDEFIALNANINNKSSEDLKKMKEMVWGSVSRQTPEQAIEWSAKQVYIALGMALTVCAELHIDASPMEGFDPKKFDEILGLSQKSLASKVLLAVGFRATDDPYINLKKVRFPKEKLFIEM